MTKRNIWDAMSGEWIEPGQWLRPGAYTPRDFDPHAWPPPIPRAPRARWLSPLGEVILLGAAIVFALGCAVGALAWWLA